MELKALGKYQILEKLGEGATAEVYHAVDGTSGQEVALKLLKPALVSDPSAFMRFQREANAASGLHHANIASVYEVGEIEGRYYIAMHYLPGRSLARLLQEDGPLTWAEALRMVTQLADALDYAHAQGFLHRDVKPSNIIVSEGAYFLTDFGLARAMQDTGLTSHSGTVLGTPPYIPPEIWLGQPAVPATDQYALACVVYEALTARVLFSGDTPPAIMTRHVLNQLVLPEAPADNLPQGLEAVLGKALAKEPAGRYPNTIAFAAALGELKDPVAERLRQEQEERLWREADEKARRENEEKARQEAEDRERRMKIGPPPPLPGIFPAFTARRSRLAVFSLVACILTLSIQSCLMAGGLFFSIGFVNNTIAMITGFVGSLAAVVTGHLAKKEIKRSNGRITGNGLATAGLVLGYLGLVVGLFVLCVVVILPMARNMLTGPAVVSYPTIIPLPPITSMPTTPVNQESMPGLAGKWLDPDSSGGGTLSTIEYKNGEYVVTSVVNSGRGPNEVKKSSWSNGVLTWEYCPSGMHCITQSTVTLAGNTLTVNWTWSDGGNSGTSDLKRQP
jgi:hypothetical protein